MSGLTHRQIVIIAAGLGSVPVGLGVIGAGGVTDDPTLETGGGVIVGVGLGGLLVYLVASILISEWRRA